MTNRTVLTSKHTNRVKPFPLERRSTFLFADKVKLKKFGFYRPLTYKKNTYIVFYTTNVTKYLKTICHTQRKLLEHDIPKNSEDLFDVNNRFDFIVSKKSYELIKYKDLFEKLEINGNRITIHSSRNFPIVELNDQNNNLQYIRRVLDDL